MTKSKSNRPTKTTTARANKVRNKRRVYNALTRKDTSNEIENISPSINSLNIN